MKLLLFDIDGTLLSASGAATKAADMAFEKFYSVKNVMTGIRSDGKTDPLILKEMFNNGLNRDYFEHEADLVFNEYLHLLNTELSNGSKIILMPGIDLLLNILSARDDILLGVATGNIEQGAWIKLRHGGLNRFFDFGGFGSDSHNRELLIRKAMERSQDFYGGNITEVFVIGDTPFDIIHGRAAGAITVGVSTGHYTYGQLSEYSPDYLFHDLTDSAAFLDIL